MKITTTILLALSILLFFIGCKAAPKEQAREPIANDSHGHSHGDGHDHSHEAAAEEGIINVSYDMQTMLGIDVAEVSRRTLYENIPALGEIKPAQVSEAEVYAPFDGVLMPDEEHGIVKPGEYVTKGEILARIAPAGGTSGWTELINDYRLAKSEFDRVMRLHEHGAVSDKRLEEATLDLENKRARMQAVLGDVNVDDEHLSEGNHFHLRAGRSGVLTDVHLRYGQRIATGEHLWSIVDPSIIWLEAQVPASEAAHITEIHDAYFTLSSQDSVYRIADLDGKLISASTLLDPVTRRLPVIFELSNKDDLLKPGSFAQVYLKTRASRDALAVPESAVLTEDGTPIVYVKATEELFEKRIVLTGIKDEGYIEIRSGLNEGEYVVSKEAYKVRLASLNVGAASDHHGHSH